MKTSIYKKDSWHYRIATSENMLIPNIFNQREEWDTTEYCYKIQPPNDSCAYWRVVLLYLLCQTPILLMFGLVFSYTSILSPFFVLFSFIDGSFYSLNEGVQFFGSVFLSFYIIAAIYFFLLFLKDRNAFSKIKMPKIAYPFIDNVCYRAVSVSYDLKEMYISLKDKYCKKLEFK